MGGGGTSVFINSYHQFACNSMYLEDTPGILRAECLGEGWAGKVTFKLGALSEAALNQLTNAIDLKIKRVNRAELEHYTLISPIFLLGFLLLSALIWVTRMAYRFVMRG